MNSLSDLFLLLLTISSFFMLLYLYGGYLSLLWLINYFVRKEESGNSSDYFPTLTVLITVFNEDDKIERRIRNVLSCEYPSNSLQIIVASDGSTDSTDSIVLSMNDERVKLFRPDVRKGKTDTQNQALEEVVSEVVVFTDADTEFDRLFLQEIVKPFSEPDVGGADGHLLFLEVKGNGISESQGFYWRQELLIRKYESQLGILAVASGACMAMRHSLFRPMLSTVGEDCLIPLDVVTQGFRMVHIESAIAYDRMESGLLQEFKTRVRMTLRNWQGTWLYPNLLNPFKNMGVAFALWSHKILRWLSPLFLLAWLFGGLALLFSGSNFALLGIPSFMFMNLALLGLIGQKFKKCIPIGSSVYSFCLANAGFFIGVLKGTLGKKVDSYR